VTYEQEPREEPFWTIDEELGELELRERPGGTDLYTVRLKAHTSSVPYHPDRELYPLAHEGTKHEVSGRAYILVPDVSLTVGPIEQRWPRLDYIALVPGSLPPSSSGTRNFLVIQSPASW